MDKIKLQDKLHYRQAQMTVLTALLLSFVISSVLIFHDFQNEIDEARAEAETILKTVKAPAARAAYGLHRDLAATVVDGMLEHQLTHRAVLYDDFGGILAELERPFYSGRMGLLSDALRGKTSSFTISLYADDGAQLVGKLRVDVDNYFITKAFFARSIRIILAVLSLSFILSILLSIEFYFFFTKPLLTTEKCISALFPDRQLKTQISPPKGHSQSELGVLVNTFNALLFRFRESEEDLRKHRDHLEEMVEKRTVTLKEEIVERKQAEDGLKESEERYRLLLGKQTEYKNRLKGLIKELSVVEERERHKIGQYLHDQICQVLALSKIKLDQLNGLLSSEVHKNMGQEIANLIEQNVNDVRSLLFDLSTLSTNLDELDTSICNIGEKVLANNKIPWQFTETGNKYPISNHIKSIICQVTRELCYNIVKHAEADKVEINLQWQAEGLKVKVSDNGKGIIGDIDSVNLQSNMHFGLFCIQERLDTLGGTFNLESVPKKGTVAKFFVPALLANEQG